MSGACRWGFTLALALGVATVDRAAWAQAPLEFPVVNFRPAASPGGYWVTEEAQLRGHLSPSAQLLLGYASRPLQVVDADTDEVSADLIRSRVNLHVLAAIGFFDRLELGVALPATLSQSGEDARLLDRPAGDALSGGLGDVRLIPKVRIASSEDEVTTFSLALPVTLPTCCSP